MASITGPCASNSLNASPGAACTAWELSQEGLGTPWGLLFKSNHNPWHPRAHRTWWEDWALVPNGFSFLSWPHYLLPAWGWQLLQSSKLLFPHLWDGDTAATIQDCCEDLRNHILTYVRGWPQCLAPMHLKTLTESPLGIGHGARHRGGGTKSCETRPLLSSTWPHARSFLLASRNLCSLFHEALNAFKCLDSSHSNT